MRFLRVHVFREHFIPPSGSVLQFGYFCREVLDGFRLFRYRMGDHGLGLRIDLQLGLTTRTFDFDHIVKL